MSGDKNDWDLDLFLDNFSLKIESTKARQSNIQNEATHLVGKLALEKDCR